MSVDLGPGDWVACIDARPSRYPWDRGFLRDRGVYCVERVEGPNAAIGDAGGLILTDPETKEWDSDGTEGWWAFNRFRPLGGSAESRALKAPPISAPVHEREDA